MATETEIINIGLDALARAEITGPDDTLEASRVMTRRFGSARDFLLRDHPWNFAKTQTTLPVDSTTPAFRWSYQYSLPIDPYCLRALIINDDPEEPFEILGRKLACDIGAPLKLAYIARIEDPGAFDAAFVELLGLYLALRTAPRLANASGSRISQLKDDYEDMRPAARSVDGQEGTPRTYFPDALVRSRQ